MSGLKEAGCRERSRGPSEAVARYSINFYRNSKLEGVLHGFLWRIQLKFAYCVICVLIRIVFQHRPAHDSTLEEALNKLRCDDASLQMMQAGKPV
jgi:hypothetical protein